MHMDSIDIEVLGIRVQERPQRHGLDGARQAPRRLEVRADLGQGRRLRRLLGQSGPDGVDEGRG